MDSLSGSYSTITSRTVGGIRRPALTTVASESFVYTASPLSFERSEQHSFTVAHHQLKRQAHKNHTCVKGERESLEKWGIFVLQICATVASTVVLPVVDVTFSQPLLSSRIGSKEEGSLKSTQSQQTAIHKLSDFSSLTLPFPTAPCSSFLSILLALSFPNPSGPITRIYAESVYYPLPPQQRRSSGWHLHVGNESQRPSW